MKKPTAKLICNMAPPTYEQVIDAAAGAADWRIARGQFVRSADSWSPSYGCPLGVLAFGFGLNANKAAYALRIPALIRARVVNAADNWSKSRRQQADRAYMLKAFGLKEPKSR